MEANEGTTRTILPQCLDAIETKGIEQPNENDVLCGRGGKTNIHIGNIHYRKIIETRKNIYRSISKNRKSILSMSIVEAINRLDPPGRFLSYNGKTGLWYEIETERATKKTSQALREKKMETYEIMQKLAEAAGGQTLPSSSAERSQPSQTQREDKPHCQIENETLAAIPEDAKIKCDISLLVESAWRQTASPLGAKRLKPSQTQNDDNPQCQMENKTLAATPAKKKATSVRVGQSQSMLALENEWN